MYPSSTVPVRVEDLGAGSPLNRLFNEFFMLNKNVLAVAINYRDEGYMQYANQQIAVFSKNHRTKYGESLAKALTEFLKREPFKVLTFEKTSPEFVFFQTFWQLHKKYINGENFVRSDEYWSKMVKEAGGVHKQYKKHIEPEHKADTGPDYCSKILTAFLDEIERRDREEKTAAGGCAYA